MIFLATCCPEIGLSSAIVKTWGEMRRRRLQNRYSPLSSPFCSHGLKLRQWRRRVLWPLRFRTCADSLTAKILLLHRSSSVILFLSLCSLSYAWFLRKLSENAFIEISILCFVLSIECSSYLLMKNPALIAFVNHIFLGNETECLVFLHFGFCGANDHRRVEI